MSIRRSKDDTGAVAILVAILSVVIFGAAALSVDIGNLWARKRELQTSVDVSALSAGHLLPWSSSGDKATIAAEVAKYLNQNVVQGQAPTVTGAQLLDGNSGNGEVLFTGDANQFTVVEPQALVDYGVGRIFSGTGKNVNAGATVRIFSPLPPKGKVFPFAMPSSCPFGSTFADTSNGGHTVSTSGSSWTATSSRNGTIANVTPTSLTYGSGNAQSVSVKLTSLGNNVSSVGIFFVNGSYATPATSYSVTPTTNSDDTRTITAVNVPAEVLDTQGTWQVWGLTGGGSAKDTTNSVDVTVGSGSGGGGGGGGVSCGDPSTGQFGQMYSPRNNQPADQTGFALNIALGLDHDITPWKNAPQNDCGQKNGTPPSGGTDDLPNPTATPNCILPQTGNDGPSLYSGLISGPGSYKGRLDVANGATKSGCNTALTMGGVPLNNDKLSCFLINGHTLSDLTATSGNFENMLDPNVVNSPRFVWIPVIYATTRADIQNNYFYAIKRFVPGFITDQTTTSPATANNGVTLNGNGNSVTGIQVFTFNPAALPVDQQSPVMDYDPLAGKTVRLID